MTFVKSAALPKLAGLLFAAALMIGFDAGANAAPLNFSHESVEATVSDGLVIKTVTRAGVAHRSARRTTRRVIRR